MKEAKKNKIQDLVEQIKRVDQMILLNASNPSTLMVEQYEHRKERILSELIDEVKDVHNLSKYSFHLIYIAISRYYPELVKSAKSNGKTYPKQDKHYKELKEIESLLVA